MSYGYTWDRELRRRLIAAVEAEKHGDYVALNKIIMEIQKPYIELLDKIRLLVI